MRTWIDRHPNLTTWAVLAVGMLLVLAWSARDVELATMQRVWLGAATVLLAGLCAWIISWEADDDLDDYGSEVSTSGDLGEPTELEEAGRDGTVQSDAPKDDVQADPLAGTPSPADEEGD